jgi:hypothetical protein
MVDSYNDGFIGGFSQLVSTSVRYGQGNVVVAKLSILEESFSPSSSVFAFYLSNDGKASWEPVTLNSNHTFSSVGGDLSYKIVGPTGAILKIRQDDGSDNCIITKVI